MPFDGDFEYSFALTMILEAGGCLFLYICMHDKDMFT